MGASRGPLFLREYSSPRKSVPNAADANPLKPLTCSLLSKVKKIIWDTKTTTKENLPTSVSNGQLATQLPLYSLSSIIAIHCDEIEKSTQASLPPSVKDLRYKTAVSKGQLVPHTVLACRWSQQLFHSWKIKPNVVIIKKATKVSTNVSKANFHSPTI